MFGRRVPPHLVFLFSLLLAALSAWGAYSAYRSGSTLWLIVGGILAVWFAVDAVRAYGWTQQKRQLDAEKAARDAQNHAGWQKPGRK